MDDDDFLYGGSAEPEPVPTTPAPEPKPVVAAIEAETIVPEIPFGKREPSSGPITPLTPLDVKAESRNGSVIPPDHGVVVQEAAVMEEVVQIDAKMETEEQEQEEEEEEEVEIEEESEDDIEFIMEPPTRSLDLRPSRPVQPRVPSATATFTPTKAPQAAGPSLTTEYTPRERGAPPKPAVTTPSAPPSVSAPPSLPPGPSAEPTQPEQPKIEEGPEPSTLPPVTAPPSHPQINPEIPGTLDGRSILDIDLANMSEKLWRRPGADISDWFNYGFDELSWEAYCYRRRELSDVSSMLKTNVLNFAGMPEDQLAQLPPEIRTMVIAGATAMMAGGGGAQMMPGMNVPMMGGDMSMPPMMGPMMVGMGGEMGMDGGAQAGMVQGAPPEQGMEQYGQPGMPPMGMPGDYAMQDQNVMQQGMYPGMEGPVAPTPVPVGAVSRGGGTPNAFRGRGMGPGMMRGGRGGFAGRGRGHATVPIRPASPLPPNVPTGPRNANKYKDRDNNAPAVEGLDYGGGQDRSSGTPVGDHEDRAGRKRRDRSPGDDRRETKRR